MQFVSPLNASKRFFTLPVILILGACVLFSAGAADVPAALKPLETRNTEVFSKYGAAIVGIECQGSMQNGKEGGFTGTGAVISVDGLILSNITTIPADAHDIRVFFTDGHVRSAQRVQTDRVSEGALIKVKADNLVYMRMADSKQYKVGDPVFSFGNSFNSIQHDGGVTFSAGNIRGLYTAASIHEESAYVGPAIETDAAVNPGSDGGP